MDIGWAVKGSIVLSKRNEAKEKEEEEAAVFASNKVVLLKIKKNMVF